MAHFAEINGQGIVERIVVVNNDVITDASGNEVEWIGVDFLHSLYGPSRWIQTSYNGKFRKNYAGIGYRYDADRDAFVAPKPFDSWLLDDETCLWYAPVSYPDDGKEYLWDEQSLQWVEVIQ